MTCAEAGKSLPGYLDGAIRSRDHAHVREHLDSCSESAGNNSRITQRLAVQLTARIDPVPVPRDLAVRIRIQASRSHGFSHRAGQMWSRLALSFQNMVRPLAVPATGGLLTALAVFVFVVQNILVGVPLGGIVPNDLPLDLVEPARLEESCSLSGAWSNWLRMGIPEPCFSKRPSIRTVKWSSTKFFPGRTIPPSKSRLMKFSCFLALVPSGASVWRWTGDAFCLALARFESVADIPSRCP